MFANDDPLGLYQTEDDDPLGLFPNPNPPKNENTSFMSDIGSGLKYGIQKLPSIATGLADLTTTVIGAPIKQGLKAAGVEVADRPFDTLANMAGEATGFTPGRWADQIHTQLTPETRAQIAENKQAWDDPNTSFLDAAVTTIANPRAALYGVAQSAAPMLAGGFVGRGAGILGGIASDTARAAIGEGAVMAGQAMDNIDKNVSPELAAAAALPIGVAGGLIGAGSGALSNRLGVANADALFTGGAGSAARGAERPFLQRLPIAVGSEAAEEALQSVPETGFSNVAEGKPFTEGMGQSAFEGALAGGIMGAGMSPFSRGAADTTTEPPPPQPQQETLALGRNPDAGALIQYPDGSVAYRSEVENFINSLPEDEQPAARARFMGYAPQPGEQTTNPDINPDETGYNPDETAEQPQLQPNAPPEVRYPDAQEGSIAAAANAADAAGASQIEQANAAQEQATTLEQASQATKVEQPKVDKKNIAIEIAKSLREQISADTQEGVIRHPQEQERSMLLGLLDVQDGGNLSNQELESRLSAKQRKDFEWLQGFAGTERIAVMRSAQQQQTTQSDLPTTPTTGESYGNQSSTQQEISTQQIPGQDATGQEGLLNQQTLTQPPVLAPEYDSLPKEQRARILQQIPELLANNNDFNIIGKVMLNRPLEQMPQAIQQTISQILEPQPQEQTNANQNQQNGDQGTQGFTQDARQADNQFDPRSAESSQPTVLPTAAGSDDGAARAIGESNLPASQYPDTSVNGTKTPETIAPEAQQPTQQPGANPTAAPLSVPDRLRAQRAQLSASALPSLNLPKDERQRQQALKGELRDRLGLNPGQTQAAPKRSPFKEFIVRHGISDSPSDVVGEGNAFRANNILPRAFRKNGLSLDALAEKAVEAGYITQDDLDAGNAHTVLASMIQDEVAGRKTHLPVNMQTDDASAKMEAYRRAEIEDAADKYGLPYDQYTRTDRLASMVRRVQTRLEQPEPTGLLKPDRILRNAQEAVARIERKRAQETERYQQFAKLTIDEQDATIDVLTDDNGHPVFARRADADTHDAWHQAQQQWSDLYGEAYTPDNAEQQSIGKNQAPTAGITEASPGSAQGNDPAAQPGSAPVQNGTGQGQQEQTFGLTSPTRSDVLTQQAAVEAEAARKEQGGDKPITRKVTADQVDLFNPQGGLFDAPADDPAPPPTNLKEGLERIRAKNQKPFEATSLTPKQYHEEKLQKMARDNDVSIAEVREMYDTPEGRTENENEWVQGVFEAAKNGATLTRLTLDKLHEIRPGAVGQVMHDYPTAKLPDGYRLPEVRKGQDGAATEGVAQAKPLTVPEKMQEAKQLAKQATNGASKPMSFKEFKKIIDASRPKTEKTETVALDDEGRASEAIFKFKSLKEAQVYLYSKKLEDSQEAIFFNDKWHIVNRMDRPESKPAPTDDLDAMFDDVLSEELAKRQPAEPPKSVPEKLRAARAQQQTKKSQPAEKFYRHNAIANEYGFSVSADGSISTSAGKESGAKVVIKGSRFQVRSKKTDDIVYSGATVESMGKFLESFWGAEKAVGGSQAVPPRTATQAAASALKNTASALNNAIDGLGALFGGTTSGRMGSGLSFDEDTYAKAKPLFQAAIANLSDAGSDIKEAMRAIVKMVLDKFGATAVQNMKPYVVRFIQDVQNGNDRNGESNVPSANSSVERDSEVAGTKPAVGDSVQDDAAGTASRPGEAGGRTPGGTGSGQQDSSGVSSGSTAVTGERGDQRLHHVGGQSELTSIVTGADFSERGGDSGITGVPPEPISTSQVDAAADQSPTGLKAGIERARANKVTVTPGDIDNIRATLPQLLPGQQEDVKLAETRFAKVDGYGMLFTNGTGTGKTFTGLGVIKRFALQGKSNTLIVAPDSKIASDWIESGKRLGLNITLLENTKDSGNGIVITTYANLGENDTLASRNWDLVVADEAHSLMQASDGEPTTYLYNLRAITNHPDGAHTRFNMLHRAELDRATALGKEIEEAERDMSASDTTDMRRASLETKSEKMQAELGDLRKKLDAAKAKVLAEVKASQGAGRTRLVALSATPFAYEKTIDWANGYLFDYNEGQASEEGTFRGYNAGSNKDRYMMQHFGYSMRYNKLTQPDAKVDRGLMQRQWNANLKKSGALSGRMLDVIPDYDRRFILVESAIGNRIDEALDWISEQRQSEKGQGPYSELSDAINEQFKYLQKRYLLEAIKATEVIPIVKQHLAMGRKVVVFHDYKKGGGFNPFRVNTAGKSDMAAAVREFEAKFKDLVNAPLGSMPSPIEVFSRELPQTLLINGDEKQADLLKRYKSFQDDANGPQVMLVQSAKNKGWSGHDTTGKHQRVLINLGQPTAPTLAIQQEGRIYRTGQASDAIMRYMNTGTNWERWTFANTIAGRASTAENLGMGEMARALKDSFIQSFEESDAYPPGHENEGKGGKERDKAANDAITEYDRAKTFYFGQQKKNSKTKAQEGADYFATPEPIGLKMAQWLDARGGEDVLEPSAGHGAIARWIPDNTSRTAIEPSLTLRSRMAMVMNPTEDRIIDGTFEDHHVGNKYDGIVMNPPFGSGGKTAIDHLAKAATHLRDGGRIVALIPTGPAADKKFDKWFYDKSERQVKAVMETVALGKIYKGDTVILKANGQKATVLRANDTAGLLVHFAGHSAGTNTLAYPNMISAVEPTGKRTESFNAAEGLQLVANIKLPQVAFERAGTSVATRIVVLEKGGANVVQRDRDYSDITDVKELFDKLEHLDFAARTKPVEAAPVEAPKAEKPASAPKPAKASANAGDEVSINGKKYEIQIYTTNAGKEKRGIWMDSKAEASKYSARTFTHSSNKGKWFVDEYWFPKDSEIIKPETGANPSRLQQSHINNGDSNAEETAKVQAGIEGKSLIDAARFIAQTGTPAQAEIAKQVISKLERLQASGVELKLIVAHRGDQVPAQMGKSRGYTESGFDSKGRDITVWVAGADVIGRVGTDYETVLHELVHAATMGVVHYGRNNPRSLAGKHVRDLSEVTSAISSHIIGRFNQADNGKTELTEFEKDMRTGGNNAFRGIDEVLSWALTSPQAQSYLEGIPYKNQNLWTRLVQAIRTLLGLSPKADTALSEVLRVAENLIASDLNDHAQQAFWHKRGIGMNTIQAVGSTVLPKKSNTKIVGQTTRQYTPEQMATFGHVGRQVTVPTLKERAQAMTKDMGKKLAQGIADQFAPVKEISKDAYALLRLSKGASGALDTFLNGGKLKLTNGVYDFDETQKGGVIDKLLKPLQGEHHDFLWWVAANRAETLMAEDRENLFTSADIAALKTLTDGNTAFDYTIQNGVRRGQVTRSRAEIYKDSQATLQAFNKNALDMAEQSGLIDPESRKVWESEFYVPFYRVADTTEGGIMGMNVKSGVVRQQAFKHLKGGKQALNSDLLDNVLMNWAHLLDASAKNRAAKATIEAAENMGLAAGGDQNTLKQIASSIGNRNGVVWFMDEGVKRYSLIDDPYLMTALTSLEYAGMRSPVMTAMGAFKNMLTIGVTASPFFKIRNLIRDSVQVIGTGNISYNPAKNVAEGWKLTNPKNDEYFRLLASGGTIHFGTMLEGSEAKRVQALVESGVDAGTILSDEHKVKAFYRKYIEPGITAYNELGNRSESVNRAALYNQLIKQGVSHADAALQARDLMDFSMQGSFTTIRFLTQVVPFMNARIQGLYKLGRAAKEDPARFRTVIAATALLSLGLLAAYSDDDDWKRRTDADRNNYWWFKFGGTAFRIPKPFEIGTIATLAERSFELAFEKEMTNERFRNQVMALLGDNLSMNPIPQIVKPVLDVYANVNSFTGTPIESMGMERLKSEYRFNDKTSMAARGISTAANAAAGLIGKDAPSPVKIDHLLQGYFGWLGTFVVQSGDLIARGASNQPTQASRDYMKTLTGGIASDLRDAPSRYVGQVYEQAKAIEQAYNTWRMLQKQGKVQEAQEFRAANQDKLNRYRSIEHVKKAETSLNNRIRMIERSTSMDADQKREMIRRLNQNKERVAKMVA